MNEEEEYVTPTITPTEESTLKQKIGTLSNREWRQKNITPHLSGGGGPIYDNPLELVSDAATGLDKATGIHNLRMKIVQPAANIHPALGVAAEVLTPDSTDLIAPGGGYVRRIVENAPLGIKLARKGFESIAEFSQNAKRVWDEDLGKWVYKLGEDVGQSLEELWQNTQARVRAAQSLLGGKGVTGIHGAGQADDIAKGAGDPRGLRTSSKFGDTFYWDNLSEKNQKLFLSAGLDQDNAVFFLSNFDKPISREVGASIQGGVYSDRTFEFMKSELFPEIVNALKGIDLSKTGNKLTVDHVAQIRATLPFYNGVAVKDFPKVRKILESVGIYGGHNPKNLRGLPFDVHAIKSRFWIDQVGADGSKFFAGKNLNSWKPLEKAAKEFSKVQAASTKLVDTLMEQIKITRTNIDQEDLINALSKVELNPSNYNLTDFNDMAQEILTQIAVAGSKPGRKKQLGTILDKSIKAGRRDKNRYYQPTLDPEGGTFMKK